MLQVVCEASPQHFHLRLCQTPHMKLPQPQLALDPCVTKLHDSSPATVSLLSFFAGLLLAAPPNGRAFCCLDNTPVCERRFGNPQAGLRRRGKSSRPPPCVVSVYAGLCPRGKHSDSSPADRGMRSVKAGSVGWLRMAHTAWSPENRSLARPSSRYSLAWCSRDRPPSVAVFYSAAVPGDPLLAITVRCRWPRLSPPLPQSVHARHPRKSARCN